MTHKLSFPYRLYPAKVSSMQSEYISLKYNKEAERLYNFIIKNTKKILPNTLNIFVIGSVIDDEEDISSRTFKISDILYQHCPYFIFNYLQENQKKKLDRPVRIIVISPSLHDNMPIFIKKTSMIYKWIQPDKHFTSFVSGKYNNLTYDFFNCPIPEFIDSDFTDFYLKGTTKKIPKYYYFRRFYRNLLTGKRERDRDRVVDIKTDKEMDRGQKDFFNQFGQQMIDSFTSDEDISFVTKFYDKLGKLIKGTIYNNGGNICLNYAVFREQWAGVEPEYFMKTFHKLFSNDVFLLNYFWRNEVTTFLYDVNSKVYLYNSSDYHIVLSNKPKYVKIYNSKRESRFKIENHTDSDGESKQFNSSDEKSKKFKRGNYIDENILYVNEKKFKIKTVKSDGNCMFNAVISQIDTYDSVQILRNKVVDYINNNPSMINDIKQNIRGEGIYATYIDKLTDERFTETEIDEKLIKLYLFFMSRLPTDSESESMRRRLNLPLTVYYGGVAELMAISQIYNININVIMGADENIIIVDNEYVVNEPNKYIYIRLVDKHINIAIPQAI